MWLIVLIALQLALLQGVWFVALIPPVMLGLLVLNIGLFFSLARPRSWEGRIIGMLLGGLTAAFLSGFFCFWEFRIGVPGVLGAYASGLFGNWAGSLADPGGVMAMTLRFIARHMPAIEIILVDILGIALIWLGGSLDREVRRQWATWPDVTSPTSSHRMAPVRTS